MAHPVPILNDIQQHNHQSQTYDDMEKGTPTAIIVEEESDETDLDLRPGHKIHIGTAIIDVLIALAPLYFIVFGILAVLRDGTLASSFRNMAILRMAKLNPTLFPIVFALIMGKFLKAVANWKLERGATVGLIQHLLGSRSLVSSITTPIKIRTSTFLVPLLVLMWILNPIGGQTSLRVVSQQSNYTEVDTPFHYLDPSTSKPTYESSAGPFDDLTNVAFNSALSAPSSAKNGSQDIYANLHIPMIETMTNWNADAEGWITTMDPNIKGVVAAIADYLEVPKQSPQLLYASLSGVPITRGSVTSISNNTAPEGSTEAKLDAIKEDLFGPDIVSTQSLFSFETSYLYADCSVTQAVVNNSFLDYDTLATAPRTNWNNATGPWVTNGQGFSVAYSGTHDLNSTSARRIGVESWMALDAQEKMTWTADLSEAWCNLTTTYVEVQAYCTNEANCTVSKMRPSKKAHPESFLTVFDQEAVSADEQSPDELAPTGGVIYSNSFAGAWFGMFVNSTSTQTKIPHDQVPLEAYFHDTVTPHYYATHSPLPLHNLSDALFSTRFTQLLNTYWLASVAPYTLVEGIDYFEDANDASQIVNNRESTAALTTSQGKFYIETTVLRCHTVYLAILMVVAVLLFAAGLVTAYLDATRKGPDVLDDFANSLRHSPYVHVDQGPSMEDGQEKARRLRGTMIRMGDVSPGGDYGVVAIGTLGEGQEVDKLSHLRKYR